MAESPFDLGLGLFMIDDVVFKLFSDCGAIYLCGLCVLNFSLTAVVALLFAS